MRKIVLIIAFLAITGSLMAQVKKKSVKPNDEKVEQNLYAADKPAYIIYNNKGEKVTYNQMVKSLLESDICLFGELHNDPISHWLEKEVLQSIHSVKGKNLVVGAEMWETDNQLLLDELQQGLIDGQSYLESSKLWPNLDTDYLPLLQYCKRNGLHFVATNVPRRYARIIYKKGVEYLDSLSTQAKSYLPPFPIHYNLEESIYKHMASAFPSDDQFEAMKKSGQTGRTAMSSGRPSNLVKAQAIKDATMAHFILKNWSEGKYFYHFNGEMHSANHTSICYYLKHYNPNVRFKTISIIKQGDIFKFDQSTNRADFNIVIPDNMAETYISSPL